ncbi:hypothetical protein Tco_1372229, partial [Tanacetum coccineum]
MSWKGTAPVARNGTKDSFIIGSRCGVVSGLHWGARVNIDHGIALALAYLTMMEKNMKTANDNTNFLQLSNFELLVAVLELIGTVNKCGDDDNHSATENGAAPWSQVQTMNKSPAAAVGSYFKCRKEMLNLATMILGSLNADPVLDLEYQEMVWKWLIRKKMKPHHNAKMNYECKASAFCIQWDEMHSGHLLNNTPF